jgi:hypothetical protein
VDFVEMSTGLDWVLRPVAERMCLYESLKDGTLDLNDIADMNEKISVDNENRSRLMEASRGK